jgi:hypothetical protein
VTRGARLTSAWLLLLLSLAGCGVLGLVGYRAFVGGDIEAAAGTPVAVEAGKGHRFTLYRPGSEMATATCTIVPANGESREVSVPGGDDGYAGSAWWSGTATLTCDRQVTGDMTNLKFTPWGIGALVVGFIAVPVVFMWAVTTMFDR